MSSFSWIFDVYCPSTVFFSFFKIYFVEVQLIYNIVLVSGVYHSDSIFLQIILHYRLLQDNGYNSLCYTAYPCCLSIFFKNFIYLFLAALSLHCCMWAFSSCGKQGLLFIVCGLLIAVASLVEHGPLAHGLQ